MTTNQSQSPPAAFFAAAKRRHTIWLPPRRGTPHFLSGTETTVCWARELQYDGRATVLLADAASNAGETLATAVEWLVPAVAKCLRINPDDADWYEAFDPISGVIWQQTHVQSIRIENGAFVGLQPVLMPGLPHRADDDHLGALRLFGFIE